MYIHTHMDIYLYIIYMKYVRTCQISIGEIRRLSISGPKLGSANPPELRGAAWPMMLGQMGAPLNCTAATGETVTSHVERW